MKPIVLHATRERPWPRTCVWNAAGWRSARAARTFLGGIRRSGAVLGQAAGLGRARPDQPERLREIAGPGIAVARQDPSRRQAVEGIE